MSALTTYGQRPNAYPGKLFIVEGGLPGVADRLLKGV